MASRTSWRRSSRSRRDPGYVATTRTSDEVAERALQRVDVRVVGERRGSRPTSSPPREATTAPQRRGYIGTLVDPKTGKLRRAWIFTLVLGYSRHLFARIVFDQRTSTWVRLHIEAFTELGGVPRTFVPDNLKAAVLRAAFGVDREDSGLNRSYVELARYNGDAPMTSRSSRRGSENSSSRDARPSDAGSPSRRLDPALARAVRAVGGSAT